MFNIYIAAPDQRQINALLEAVQSADTRFRLCGQAATSETALTGLLREGADVLLMGAEMPPIDGRDLHRAAFEVRRHLLVVQASDGSSCRLLSGGEEAAHGTLPEMLADAAAELSRRPVPPGRPSRQESLESRLLAHLLLRERTTTQVLEEAAIMGLDLAGYWHVAAALHLGAGLPAPETAAACRELLSGKDGLLVHFDGRSRLALLSTAAAQDEASSRAAEVLGALREQLEPAGIAVTGVLGAPVNSLEALPKAYDAACAILDKTCLSAPGAVTNLAGSNREPAQWSVTFSSLCAESLAELPAVEIPGLLKTFLSRIGEAQLGSILHRYHLLADMLGTAVRMLGAVCPEEPAGALMGGRSAFDLFMAASTRSSFEQTALALLEEAVQLRDRAHPPAGAPDAIGRALAFINENYSRSDMSLQQAAREAGFSAAHFSTVFARKMGCTFIEYLTALRLGKAKELLAATDRKLSQIAVEVGYSDPNYFGHVFKKREGVPPKEFRRRLRESGGGRSV